MFLSYRQLDGKGHYLLGACDIVFHKMRYDSSWKLDSMAIAGFHSNIPFKVGINQQ
jgi:hypothetical protein